MSCLRACQTEPNNVAMTAGHEQLRLAGGWPECECVCMRMGELNWACFCSWGNGLEIFAYATSVPLFRMEQIQMSTSTRSNASSRRVDKETQQRNTQG